MRVPGPARETTASRRVTVAICGNPNCGKTTIFNGITGLNQKVGNYPGVTVEKVSGQFQIESLPGTRFTLVDVPGTYSLAAFSPDEYIAALALFGGIKGEEKPDAAICVIDSTNLERGLYFLFQVMQIGCPVVVALNMIDLSERRGLQFDSARLSELLGGVPVVPLIGSRGKGIAELKEAVGKIVVAPTPPPSDWYHPLAAKAAHDLCGGASTNGHRSRAECYRVLFDVSGPAEQAFLAEGDGTRRESLQTLRKEIMQEFSTLSAGETGPLTSRAQKIFDEVVSKSGRKWRSRS